MKEATKSSLSFVITVIYTYTFGNAIYRVIEFDSATSTIQLVDGFTWVHGMEAVVCVTMALRFFFGNNSYIEHLFSSSIAPIYRLYQRWS